MERIPPLSLSIQERRARFARLAFDRRAKKVFEEHVASLKKTTPVNVSQSAEADMAAAMDLFR